MSRDATANETRPAEPARPRGPILEFLEMIKVGHTLFALPFALGATILAAGGLPPLPLLGKIIAAVLFARTAAMAFNRYVDRRIDARNPRTAGRSIPSGRLDAGFVLGTVGFSSALFVATAAWIGPLPLRLSPIALVVLLGYSVAKRFTSLCHFALGVALGLAPVGAWVAVRGSLEPAPWILGSAVMFWTAGFDVLYSTLDHEFDRSEGLHSLPVRLGVAGALRLAFLLHLAMLAALVALGVVLSLGPVYFVTLIAVAAVVVIEHRLVRPDDLTRVNQAFFHWNVVISLALFLALSYEGFRVGTAAG